MEDEKKCKKCGSIMEGELDDCEPLMMYHCTNPSCEHKEIVRINGYEG